MVRSVHDEWMLRSSALILAVITVIGTAGAGGAGGTSGAPSSVVSGTRAVWSADVAVASPQWNWPIAGAQAIARPYLAPATKYGAGHRGVDLAGAGDLIAPADGIVHFSGRVVDRGVLSIDHGGGLLSSYEPVETDLVAGDPVLRGDVIGEILPGHCRSPCLHLGARIDGEYVSPLLHLGGVPRAVLLPTRSLPGE
jgi:murein DD-endopeptidase MepM/ murein hydrolase activator NlpD